MRKDLKHEALGSKKKILLTAFEPFGGQATNSTQEILNHIKEDHRLQCVLLPVEFERSWQTLKPYIDPNLHCCVLNLGQAEGRKTVTVERVAINVIDARIPDNAGRQLTDTPIVPNGPAAYFSTLPIKELITSAVEGSGAYVELSNPSQELTASPYTPITLSNTAGTYVCNEIMYRTLHHCLPLDIPAGFIHFPVTNEQSSSGRSLEDLIRTTRQICEKLYFKFSP